MLDFKDQPLFEKDIIFEPTVVYKTRNLLKTFPKENPYYPNLGIDLNLFFQLNLSQEALKTRVIKYLLAMSTPLHAITFTYQQNGQLILNIEGKEVSL